jgi:putative phosphoesterase
MLVALLSDTHDNAAATKAALALLAPHRPAAYLHAGDLVDAGMLFHFAGIGTFHFVFGNNEFDHAAIRTQALALELTCHEQFADLTFAKKRMALLHGHDSALFNRVASSGEYQYIIHGHTHVRRDVRLPAPSGTRIINPGALYRAKTKTVALLDVVSDNLQFLEVAM